MGIKLHHICDMNNSYLEKWGLPREEIPLCAWKVKATAWICRISTSFHSSNFLGKSNHDVLFQRNMKPEGLGATDCKWRNGANHYAVNCKAQRAAAAKPLCQPKFNFSTVESSDRWWVLVYFVLNNSFKTNKQHTHTQKKTQKERVHL